MKVTKIKNATIMNIDCMEYMKTLPDKYFDLAIVDPPYGIGDKFKGGKFGKMQFNDIVKKGWDKIPDKIYFDYLIGKSKNQIIWGGNYFHLSPTRCFIVWDKMISEDFSLAMAELAWTSFDKLAKIYKQSVPKTWKIHPTQKPVKLYEWILTNYAKPGQKIFDSHMGSGSSAIACNNLGFEYVGCELDEDYYNAACERIAQHAQQQRLFE